jgi:hypothetical protein
MTPPDARTSPVPIDAVPASVPDRPVRDWWVMTGMTIAAASAALASFSGLYGLAAVAGWPLRLAWLLPVTLDAYAMTSARVWLASSTPSTAARRFARANALGAIAASITGNAAYHAVHTGLLTVSWPIVVLVGAVPAAVLGLTAHLHALRSRTEPTPPTRYQQKAPTRVDEEPDSARRVHARRHPRHRTEDELLAAARTADTRYRERHGKPITRDALRMALRISTPRATELRSRLKATDTGPAPTDD